MSNPHAIPSTSDFSAIATQWSLVMMAHRGTVTSAGPARNELVIKYRRAIRAYLGAVLRNDHDADELTQEVILRLLSGHFAGASPEKGRFRNYLKTAVRNLVHTHWQQRQREAAVDLDSADVAAAVDEHEEETLWNYDWRCTVLHSAWAALRKHEESHLGNSFYTVLRLRSENPELNSNALARRMEQTTGQVWNAANVRQQLRRARFYFAQLLVEEVAHSLDFPIPDAVEEELNDLGLMKYVRAFLPPDWKERGELRDPEG
jgi:RNA polymerase sigma-70 factor (ECF subfamily)